MELGGPGGWVDATSSEKSPNFRLKDPQSVVYQAELVLCGREWWPTARPGDPLQELRTAASVIPERDPDQCPNVIVSVVRFNTPYAVSSPGRAHELAWWRIKPGNKSL
jgi:hypothetical protein